MDIKKSKIMIQALCLSLLVSCGPQQNPVSSPEAPPVASTDKQVDTSKALTTPSPTALPTSSPSTNKETKAPKIQPSSSPAEVTILKGSIPSFKKASKIKIESLNPLVPFIREVTTNSQGQFEVKDVPIKVSLKITGSDGHHFCGFCRNLLESTFQLEAKIENSQTFTTERVCAKACPDDTGQPNNITFNGKVFDDTHAPLDGVKIVAKSLNSSVAFHAETSTVGGTYSFNNATSRAKIKVTASKEGFTTRHHVIQLKSNKEGDPNANRFYFGHDSTQKELELFGGNDHNALSDKPEVMKTLPERNSADNDSGSQFVLTFSETMDRDSVEDTFAIRAFNSKTLSVDDGQNANTFTGSSDISLTSGNLIWDKNAFDISWNKESTQVTFIFKDERILPTDKDAERTPDYQILFGAQNQNRLIKDSSGISRSTQHFHLVDDEANQESFKFSIRADQLQPGITSVTAQTDENSGTNGDAIQVKYSEPMIFYTKSVPIAGGKSDTPSSTAQAPAGFPNAINSTPENAAKNYTVTITPQGTTIASFTGSWYELGGTAVYDVIADATHKTVILLPPKQSLARTSVEALVNGDTLTGTIWYSDGTKEALPELTITGNSWNELQNVLNTLEEGGDGFTVAEITDSASAGITESGDLYRMTLASDSKNSAGDKTITAIRLEGGTAASNLGISSDKPYWIIPGGPDSTADFYNPGDTIKVEVAPTVVDPAGNSIDTNDDDDTAVAS